jgi:flagellar export protein FliJ
MKSFRFRGERLLEWRRVQADAARVAFVRASESAREAAGQAARADADCARCSQEFREAMSEPVGVATVERYRIWIGQQQARADACHRLHGERQDAADAAARILRTANRHVKVMERLRDRAAGRHAEAMRQAEIAELNELATIQFVRRRMEGAAEHGD